MAIDQSTPGARRFLLSDMTMKKFLPIGILSVVFNLPLHVGAAAADGAILFDQTNFLKEPAVLSFEELKSAETLRSRTNLADHILISVNLTALESGVVTVVTPEGKQIQFVGSKRSGNESDRTQTWLGRSRSGDLLSVGFTGEGLAARFTDGPIAYRILSLPGGRLHMLSRIIPQTRVEPEPRPWKPSRPASGAGK